ncbi:uncharacterized protein METZ01_LOCUS383433 [marine metagenome]|uniref:Uncharacterized protein n=1 Tax=marine metagenome TaxID=408172 RepID=A0A382U8G1_9ZZZZ
MAHAATTQSVTPALSKLDRTNRTIVAPGPTSRLPLRQDFTLAQPSIRLI